MGFLTPRDRDPLFPILGILASVRGRRVRDTKIKGCKGYNTRGTTRNFRHSLKPVQPYQVLRVGVVSYFPEDGATE